jgi:hypothetical protein
MYKFSFENGVLTATREDGGICILPYNPETQIGWSSEDEAMGYFNSKNLQFIVATPMQAFVPQSVTMRQARLALLEVELLDDVEAVLATQDRAVQIEWEYATTVERTSPLVGAIGQMVSYSDEQINELFIKASKL